MGKTIQRKLLTYYQEKEITGCSNHKMSRYGDQPTIKVNIREFKLFGIEIASCYIRLRWELDNKLERKGKRSPNEKNTIPHADSSPAAQQKVQKPGPRRPF